MIDYNENNQGRGISARFGTVVTSRNTNHDAPAIAPVIMRNVDAEVAVELFEKGAEIPVIVIPLSMAKDLSHALAPLMSKWIGQRTLDATIYNNPPMPILDTEPESFSFGCRARADYQKKYDPPKYVLETVLNSGLSPSKKDGKLHYVKAWKMLWEQFGLAGFRAWQEGLQLKAGTPIFLAPTPLIRRGVEHVDFAFAIGKEQLNTVEMQSFEGIGLDLMLHSEVLDYDHESEITRRAIIENLRGLARGGGIPTTTPFVSLRIIDHGKLIDGPQSKNARVALRELLSDMAEVVRDIRGIFILHNVGTWSLAGVDLGADIVSFRSDGTKFKVDPIYYGHYNEGATKHRTIQPFNVVELCDDTVRNFQRMWDEASGFPAPSHVEPKEFWKEIYPQQLRYKASLVMDGLLDMGKEYRESATSDISVKDGVRSRVSRMREQDAMYDLCPSLAGR